MGKTLKFAQFSGVKEAAPPQAFLFYFILMRFIDPNRGPQMGPQENMQIDGV